MTQDAFNTSIESVDENVQGVVGQRVMRNYMLGSVRMVASQLVGGAVFVVLSLKLAPPQYALYAAFAVAAPVAYFLVGSPVATVLVRRKTLERQTVNSAFTGIEIAVAAVCGLALLTTPFLTRGAALVVSATCVYLVLLGLCFPSYVVLQRNLKSGKVALFDFSERVAFQLCAVLCVLAGVAIHLTVALALLTAGLASVVVSQILHPWRLSFSSPRTVAPELREAIHPFLVAGTLLSMESLFLPIVGVVSSGRQAGLYGWALSAAALPVSFVNVAVQTLFPAFARLDDKRMPEAVAIANRFIAAFGVTFAAFVAAATPPLLPLLFPGRAWTASIPTLWVLLAALAVYSLSVALTAAWTSHGSLSELARLQTIAVAAAFACAIPAAGQFGAIGAALGYLGGRSVMTCAALILVRRRIGVPVDPTLVVYPLLAAAAFGVAHFGSQLIPSLLAQAFVAGTVAVAICTVGLLALTRGALAEDFRLGYRLLRGTPQIAAQ